MSTPRSEEPADPLRVAQRTLNERYRRLVLEPLPQELGRCQEQLEALLWFGEPGSSAPSLLREELGIVKQRAEQRREGAPPPDLMILCVGYSPEPLLLAVAHHAPAAVLLLLAQDLDARYLATLQRLWDDHRDLLGVPSFHQLERRTVRDAPHDVFLTVREVAEKRRASTAARIVVDITGAKKSMIAGAFLAAGLLDLESSYVDFDEYDVVLRRPVPGTSQPGELPHPYQLFRLREERRLAEAFDQRRFREALLLANELAAMAESSEVRDAMGSALAEHRQRRFAALAQVAAAYAHWSDGFYVEAAEAMARCPGLPIPASVEALAPIWPRSTDKHSEIVAKLSEERVFADPAVALAYFLDVLVWAAEAKIADRPRDVYLRLYGTIESVLFFAFHFFVTVHPERLEIVPQDPAASVAELRSQVVETCRTSSGAALKILRGSPGLPASPGLPGSVSLAAPAIPKEVSSRLFRGKGELNLQRFTDLRNKAVHWLAPVPRDSTTDLLTYYRTVLKELIPVITNEIRATPGLAPDSVQRLDAWERRLLAAARGAIPSGLAPFTSTQVFAALGLGD